MHANLSQFVSSFESKTRPATGSITMTMPLPKLTPVVVPGTAAPCILRILGLSNGLWAGHAISEVEWSSVCGLYYILLLHINISLLLIITWPARLFLFITNVLLLLIITSIILTYYYKFCYYTIITSLLHIITSHYYLLLHFVLWHIITKSILPIVMTSLLHIIMSLLRHYSQLQKQVIISSLLHIMHYPCFHHYIIITNY